MLLSKNFHTIRQLEGVAYFFCSRNTVTQRKSNPWNSQHIRMAEWEGGTSLVPGCTVTRELLKATSNLSMENWSSFVVVRQVS